MIKLSQYNRSGEIMVDGNGGKFFSIENKSERNLLVKIYPSGNNILSGTYVISPKLSTRLPVNETAEAIEVSLTEFDVLEKGETVDFDFYFN